MILIRENAFVLRLVPYKERDLIIEFLGNKTGRFTGVLYRARGQKDSFLFQPGDQIEIEYQRTENQDLVRLGPSIAVKLNRADKLSYLQFVCLSFFLELYLKIAEPEVGSNGLFDLMGQFQHLGMDLSKPHLALMYGVIQLSFFSGFGFDLSSCCECGKSTHRAGEHNKYRKQTYQLELPGLICGDCSTPNFPLEAAAVKAMVLAGTEDFLAEPPEIPIEVTGPLLLSLSNRLIRACEINCRSFGLLERLLLSQGVQ